MYEIFVHGILRTCLFSGRHFPCFRELGSVKITCLRSDKLTDLVSNRAPPFSPVTRTNAYQVFCGSSFSSADVYLKKSNYYLTKGEKKEMNGSLQLPFLFLCSATVRNYSTNKKGSSMVATAGNISFLKGDYTEENRYFGNVLGMTLLDCQLGPLRSPCKNIFFRIY